MGILRKFIERNAKRGDRMGKRKRIHDHGDGKKTVIVYGNQQADSFWETEIREVKECSKAPKEIEVKISPLVKVKIEALMEKYSNIEWLAYLLGKDLHVEDIFVPNQKVSSGSVNNIDCKEFNTLPIVGVIHSHHNMGAFFSHTDDSYINQNHDISIVVSKNGPKGQVRWKTPCGAVKTVDAKIKLDLDVDFNEEDFLKEAGEKIKEHTYPVVTSFQGNWGKKIGNYHGCPNVNGQPWNKQEEKTEEENWDTGRDAETKVETDSDAYDNFMKTLSEEEKEIVAELEQLENMPLS